MSIKRKVSESRMKEVLSEATPNIDQLPENDLKPEIASENTKKPKRKIPNKKAYQLDELLSTVKLINEGKGLDEISQITKRPPASILYKFFSPRGLLNIRSEAGVREWWLKRNPTE